MIGLLLLFILWAILLIGYFLIQAVKELKDEVKFSKPSNYDQLKEPIERLTKAIYLLMGALPKDKK